MLPVYFLSYTRCCQFTFWTLPVVARLLFELNLVSLRFELYPFIPVYSLISPHPCQFAFWALPVVAGLLFDLYPFMPVYLLTTTRSCHFTLWLVQEICVWPLELLPVFSYRLNRTGDPYIVVLTAHFILQPPFHPELVQARSLELFDCNLYRALNISLRWPASWWDVKVQELTADGSWDDPLGWRGVTSNDCWGSHTEQNCEAPPPSSQAFHPAAMWHGVD